METSGDWTPPAVDIKRKTGINRHGVLGGVNTRASLTKDAGGLAKSRHESFKELMLFNLDTQFAEAERNLTMVNAT